VLDRQSGSLEVPGYNRISLNSPISVSAGERFAIIVKLTDPGYTYPAGYSCATPNWKTENATATPGVGFISSSGLSWSDITSGSDRETYSVCLKAFADDDTSELTIAVTVSPKSASLQTGGMQAFTATVTGTSNTAVTWSVPSGHGTIAQMGTDSATYTAPAIAGMYTLTATSQADASKYDTATVTVTSASIVFTNIPKALFVNDTTQLQASVSGLANTAINWSVPSGQGTVTPTGFYTAPATIPVSDGKATITAASVQVPAISGQAKILIRPLSFASFDNNTKTSPQLLDLANAFGSIAKADLDKYDINGDGIINDEDLAMLFNAMRW
jgi:hypothetical protein